MGPRSGDRGNSEERARLAEGTVLQWGRGQVTAEMPDWFSWPPEKPRLQWGRGQVTAEMPVRFARFTCVARLQWGRGQVTAEMRSSSPPKLSSAASMGPRSGDRGNAMMAFPQTEEEMQLQWGRGQVTAEMNRPHWSSLGRLRLQWGRGQVTAEMSPEAYCLHPDPSLQWGRGQVTAEIITTNRNSARSGCFNGAAVR